MDAEYRYTRCYELLEVCGRLGITLRPVANEYRLALHPGGRTIRDHPELLCSLIEWKGDLLKILRYLESVS